MNKNIFSLVIIFSVLLIHNNNFCTTEQISGWWDFCLDNTVSYKLFEEWLGDIDSASRVNTRNYIKKQSYNSILDIACGLCIDYFGFKKDNVAITYKGIDFSRKLVAKAQEKGIDVSFGDIENIELPDDSFDIVYGRHILEHLKYYDKALSEAIRIAKKEVLIVFFIKPSDKKEDVIDLGFLDGHSVYHNKYSQSKFVEYVLSHEKVDHCYWENINEKEMIAHIYIKN